MCPNWCTIHLKFIIPILLVDIILGVPLCRPHSVLCELTTMGSVAPVETGCVMLDQGLNMSNSYTHKNYITIPSTYQYLHCYGQVLEGISPRGVFWRPQPETCLSFGHWLSVFACTVDPQWQGCSNQTVTDLLARLLGLFSSWRTLKNFQQISIGFIWNEIPWSITIK